MTIYEITLKQALGDEWFSLLREEVNKPYFKGLASYIHEARRVATIYPINVDGIFSVFKNISPKKVKVIILGQDPYPDGSYDGMAFSNNEEKNSISPSLTNILKEVESDIYDGLKLDLSPNLDRWQAQGVFLLNRILTVEAGKPRSHAGIGWEKFTEKVIRILSEIETPKVFMLWGNDAKKVEKFISGKHNLVLKSGHPSPLSANQGLWFGNKHFSKANDFLAKHNMKRINW